MPNENASVLDGPSKRLPITDDLRWDVRTGKEINPYIDDRQKVMAAALREDYEVHLADEMGRLHNQFVAFIATARLPLPHVLMVLDMLKRETLDQAYKDFLGE